MSPFELVPPLPAGDLAIAPLAALLAIAGLLADGGITAFEHRDLTL